MKPNNQLAATKRTDTAKLLGPSSDWRTERWEVRCAFENCSHEFEPPTTMFQLQHLRCPRCGGEQFIDYGRFGA